MATRIDLPKHIVQHAFKQRIQSLQRSIKEASNELVRTALNDELAQTQAAVNTVAEIK